MRSRLHLSSLLFGLRHLLGGSLWTPPALAYVFRDLPERADEETLKAVFAHWAQQQQVAWVGARLLAWWAILDLVFW